MVHYGALSFDFYHASFISISFHEYHELNFKIYVYQNYTPQNHHVEPNFPGQKEGWSDEWNEWMNEIGSRTHVSITLPFIYFFFLFSNECSFSRQLNLFQWSRLVALNVPNYQTSCSVTSFEAVVVGCWGGVFYSCCPTRSLLGSCYTLDFCKCLISSSLSGEGFPLWKKLKWGPVPATLLLLH